ncbi:MAG: hypothetical protein UZ17_ACD001001148 [Acidobacteria bacterium OLB17]|nr:MAG: hypothetical protein UZ17_ACD001001148 [Acidobacteria bacterium OLB17]
MPLTFFFEGLADEFFRDPRHGLACGLTNSLLRKPVHNTPCDRLDQLGRKCLLARLFTFKGDRGTMFRLI